MTGFDYVVLFLAIPVGLALAEMAQGLSVALRRIGQFTIGWLTPLLVFFILMLTSLMLESFFSVRENIDADAPVLFLGLVYTFGFYVAASFVFPESFEPGVSLDDWFMANRKYSLGVTSFLVLLAVGFYIVAYSTAAEEHPIIGTIVAVVFMIGFFLPVYFALRARTKRTALIAMTALNGLYLGSATLIIVSR